MMPAPSCALTSMQESVVTHDLLKHPFYQAWNMGALPTEALRAYAEEYGVFIRSIADGWTTLGELEGAQIERRHADLWDGFALSLGTSVQDAPNVPAVVELLRVTKESFATTPGAIGALYAFELQQPQTAETKLAGLKTHYAHLGEGVKPYFEAHVGESGEDTLLEAKLAALSPADQQIAAKACEAMASALYNALSGLTPAHLMN